MLPVHDGDPSWTGKRLQKAIKYEEGGGQQRNFYGASFCGPRIRKFEIVMEEAGVHCKMRDKLPSNVAGKGYLGNSG